MTDKYKSNLVINGLTLAQVGQKIAYAVVDGGGTDEDTKRVLSDEALTKSLAQVILGKAEVVLKKIEQVASTFLRRLGLTGEIPPTDGKQTIFHAKKTFTAYIDPDFKDYGLDVRSEAKGMLLVESFKLTKDGTFQDIFGSFGVDLNRLVLTQDQIIWVVENRPEMLLQNGNYNFFLMKNGDEFFVAGVGRYSGGLRVCAGRLSDAYVWSAGYPLRVVVPQL